LVTTLRDAVGAGVMSPNEGRSKLDLKPVEGGESPYLQQQNYSLAALAKRDAQDDPFAPNTPALPPPAAAPAAADAASAAAADEQKLAALAQLFAWELKDAARASYGPQ
jgi:phage portal protein BeeE